MILIDKLFPCAMSEKSIEWKGLRADSENLEKTKNGEEREVDAE